MSGPIKSFFPCPIIDKSKMDEKTPEGASKQKPPERKQIPLTSVAAAGIIIVAIAAFFILQSAGEDSKILNESIKTPLEPPVENEPEAEKEANPLPEKTPEDATPETGGTLENQTGVEETDEPETGGSETYEPGEVRYASIEIDNHKFDPNYITAYKGQKVIVTLKNKESSIYGMKIDEYDINELVLSGQSKRIEFTANKVGKFKIKCAGMQCYNYPLMVGQLWIKEQ